MEHFNEKYKKVNTDYKSMVLASKIIEASEMKKESKTIKKYDNGTKKS